MASRRAEGPMAALSTALRSSAGDRTSVPSLRRPCRTLPSGFPSVVLSLLI